MATLDGEVSVNQIGEASGVIWKLLDQHGPLTVAKLARQSELSRDAVAMAIGWLAREDKIEICDTKRGRVISLR